MAKKFYKCAKCGNIISSMWIPAYRLYAAVNP